MIINKKISRTMMENKSQYFGSLALIIISCLLFTMFNQLTSNMVRITSSFEKNYNLEDASFIAGRNLSNIEALESKFNMIIEETKSIDYSISKDRTLRIFSENEKVNIPAIIEGKALSSSDILIDPAYAKANKLKIGDSIVVYNKAFKISGFMSLPNYIYPLKLESDLLSDPNSFGIAVISKEDFNHINIGSSFYSIKFKGDKSGVGTKIAQFKDYLKEQNIDILKWDNASENPRITYVDTKIESINKLSSSMPIAILILTCILISIVMWRMLKREFIIIGTLYAVGYRKKEIMKHYLIYPLSIALVGGVIGTILGAFTLKPMLNVMLTYFNMPMGNVSFSLTYVLISILLPVVFLNFSGYFVINRALKYSPIELMRGGRVKGRVSFIEKRLRLDRFKFSTKFKIREQLRSTARSLFLLLGIVFATMLLLLGFAAKSSMNSLVKGSYEGIFKYKYYYAFNSLQQGTPASGESFSEFQFALQSDDKTKFIVYGVSPHSQYVSLKDKSENKLSTESVIITRPLADRLKVKPKDTIQAINKLDSKTYTITVDNIAETYAGEYVFMPLAKLNDMLKYPSSSYIGLWSGYRIDIPQGKLLSSGTIDDLKNAFNAAMQPLQYSVGIMSFVSFIIGLIVIYVVTSMIIEENRKNISLMKVFGYRKKEVYSLILNSSFFIVVIGYILGVPLLLTSLSVMFKSLTQSMNFTFPVIISYNYIFLGFVIIYITYEISKSLSRRKINKITMAEALKSELE